jgi:tetratricopeptide (TPR) repeat protein
MTRAMPPVSVANRAAVLQQLDDLPGAVAAMTEALKLAPADQPMVLNSACYILALAGRPTEGLPYCEHALALAPDIAAIHDSYAAALERLNRCTEAQAQLAEARRLDPTSPDYRRTACAGK